MKWDVEGVKTEEAQGRGKLVEIKLYNKNLVKFKDCQEDERNKEEKKKKI